MAKVSAGDIRNGVTIEVDGKVCPVRRIACTPEIFRNSVRSITPPVFNNTTQFE